MQLHGDETPQVCAVLKEEGFSVVKALGIGSTGDVSAAADYQEVCDALLFDTKSPRRGGTGRRFDWSLLKEYDGPLPFLLGGGIGPKEASEIAAFHHPKFLGVDLNSRFETEPGVKDVPALRDFIGRVVPGGPVTPEGQATDVAEQKGMPCR